MRWVVTGLFLIVLGVAVWFALEGAHTPSAGEGEASVTQVSTRDASDTADRVAIASENATRVETEQPAIKRPARIVRVTVVDASTRQALAGANVQCAEDVVDPDGKWNVEARGESIRTDGAGTAMLAVVGDSIVASQPGYVTAAVSVDGDSTHIALEAATRVFGRVIDKRTGAPIARASLTVEMMLEPRSASPRTVTDARGAYVLEGLPAKEHSVAIAVRIDGCVPIEDRFFLDAPGEFEHDILVDFGHVLRGRVVDGITRTPIDGAIIRGETLGSDYVAQTDRDGRFAVAGIGDKSSYRFFASKPGTFGSSVVVDTNRVFDFSREVVLPLVTECTISGTVVDVDGALIGRAGVGWRFKLGLGSQLWRSHVPADSDVELRLGPAIVGIPHTDESGRFELRGLRPWTDYEFVVVDPRVNVESVFTIRFDAPGEVQTRRFTLTRGAATIEGRVFVDGVPGTGTVTWAQSVPSTGASMGKSFMILSDGWFHCSLVGAGSIELVARARAEDGPIVCERIVLDAIAAGSTTRRDFSLVANSRRIEGFALDRDRGEPAAGVTLVATAAPSQTRVRAVCDPNGHFVFDLPFDLRTIWNVEAEDATFARIGLGSWPGENDVRVELERKK